MSSLSFTTPGWYSSRWPTISTRSAARAAATTASASADGLRHRLLDEAVLARRQDALRERGVRRHGRGEGDGVERVVGEHLVEIVGESSAREHGAVARARVASEASQHQASSLPGSAAKLRARFGPQ